MLSRSSSSSSWRPWDCRRPVTCSSSVHVEGGGGRLCRYLNHPAVRDRPHPLTHYHLSLPHRPPQGSPVQQMAGWAVGGKGWGTAYAWIIPTLFKPHMVHLQTRSLPFTPARKRNIQLPSRMQTWLNVQSPGWRCASTVMLLVVTVTDTGIYSHSPVPLSRNVQGIETSYSYNKHSIVFYWELYAIGELKSYNFYY